MLKVYLDQNKWIDLARAATGHPLGTKFQSALTIAEDFSHSGAASFPLSAIHYQELWRNRNDRQRRDLANTMLKLSRPPGALQPHTIAPRKPLVESEFLVAMHRRLGRPAAPILYPPFGAGAGHAFALPGINLPPLANQHEIARWEEQILSGPPSSIPTSEQDKLTQQQYVLEFLDGEAKRITMFRSRKGDTFGNRKYLAVRLIEEFLKSFVAPLLPTLEISSDEFLNLYRYGDSDLLDPEQVVADIPTLFASYQLHVERYKNLDLPRKKGDLRDGIAMSSAVVYCDIIVAEKAFTSHIRKARLDSRFKTIVTTDLTQLPSILLATK